jgi:hypothetical protein
MDIIQETLNKCRLVFEDTEKSNKDSSGVFNFLGITLEVFGDIYPTATNIYTYRLNGPSRAFGSSDRIHVVLAMLEVVLIKAKSEKEENNEITNEDGEEDDQPCELF